MGSGSLDYRSVRATAGFTVSNPRFAWGKSYVNMAWLLDLRFRLIRSRQQGNSRSLIDPVVLIRTRDQQTID